MDAFGRAASIFSLKCVSNNVDNIKGDVVAELVAHANVFTNDINISSRG
jgi:hypothetical protein